MGAFFDNANASRNDSTASAHSVAARMRLLAGASAVALLLAASAPAFGQSVGGAGGDFGGSKGGAGASALGSAGSPGLHGAGGGGGAAGAGTVGGAGGIAIGGGGAGGAGGGTFSINAVATGAASIDGGIGAAGASGGGGGGGAGGSNVTILSGQFEAAGVNAVGGFGGPGGQGTAGGNGGNGGDGGAGAFITGGGRLVIDATSTFTGGAGGAGGTVIGGGVAGAHGASGAGVVLSNGIVNVAGQVNGGDGVPIGPAIETVAGTTANTLQILSGATLLGDFRLNNASALTLDQTTVFATNNGPTAPNSITIANNITGGGALNILAGTNTVTLSGTNTFSGGSTVTTGTLAVSNVAALGSGGITLSGGASSSAAGHLTLGSGITLNQNLKMLANSSVSVGGNVALGAIAISGDPTINVTGVGNTTGAITDVPGGPAGELVVLGATADPAANVLTMTGASTYTGPTKVGDGVNGVTLKAGGLNFFSAASATTVNAGGVLDINGFGQTVSSLSGAGTVTNSAVAQAFLTNQGASSQFDGVIVDGPGGNNIALQQNSAGNTLTLTGANTSYHGPTQIVAGTLALKTGGSIANSADVQIATGATFDISATTAGATINTVSDLSGGRGSVALGAQTLTLANAGTTFSGVISGSGGVRLLAGTQTLAGVNTYTGATTLSGGTLALSGAGSLASSLQVEIAGGATFDISATTAGSTVQALLDSGPAPGGSVVLGSKTLTIQNPGGAGLFTGIVSGSGGLTIAQGEQDLGGVNTYTGQTNVQSGATLKLVTGGSLFHSSVTNVVGTLDLTTTAQTIDAVNLNGGTIQGGSLTGAVASAGGTVNGVGGAMTLAVNPGTTTLSGNNTYSGATTVNGGGTLTGANNAFSQTSTVTINPNGTVDLGGSTQTNVPFVLGGGALKNGTLTGGSINETAGADAANVIANTISNIGGSASLTTAANTSTTLTGTNTFLSITNAASASITNNGTTFDDLNNAGIYTNNGTQNAIVATNSGSIVNSTGAIWNGAVNGPNTGTITNNNGANWNGNINAGANTTGTITNLGTWTGFGNNDGGLLNNDGTWQGSISNNSGTFNNNATGVVTGTVINAGTGSNAGKITIGLVNTGANPGASSFNNTNWIAGPVTVAGGTVTNSGKIDGLASILANGQLIQTSTGSIGNGVDNSGIVQAAGTITGAITNETGGLFTVTGNLASDGVSTFTNMAGATLNVASGAFTNLKTLDNAGDVSVTTSLSVLGQVLQHGPTFTINPGGSVTADQFIQTGALSVTTNNGTLTVAAANPIQINAGTLTNNKTIVGSVNNSGTFNNNFGASVSGDVNNLVTAFNGGLISGHVTNQGTFTSGATGEIDTGVTNTGTFNAQGTIKGNIDNNLGTFTVTGALQSDGGSTFTNGAGATLNVAAPNAFTNLASLVNQTGGIVTVGGTLKVGTIDQRGTFTNTGTVTTVSGFVVNGGTLTTTGVITGGLTNNAAGTVNAQGSISGGVNNSGAFVVTGNLANNSGDFTNSGAGTLLFGPGASTYSGIATLTNSSTAAPWGINIGANKTISAVTVINNANAGIRVAGALNASGNIANNAGATLLVTPTGALNAVGAIANTGTLTSTGTVSAGAGFTNFNIANLAGQIVGSVDNKSPGVLTVTGPLTSDGASTILNEAGGTFTIQGAFTNVVTFNNLGNTTIALTGSLGVGTLNQYDNTFANNGVITATNRVNVIGGAFNNAGTINGGANVTGGQLTTTGVINGGLNNSATTFAQGTIAGGVTNSKTFVVTGPLDNSGGNFVNTGTGFVSFAALPANIAFTKIAAFSNDGTVTIGQFAANTQDSISATSFTNNASGIVKGVGTITTTAGFTNSGSVYVGAPGLTQQNGYVLNLDGSLVNNGSIHLGPIDPASANAPNTLNVGGPVSGAGTIFTAADLGNARANTIVVGPVVGPAGTGTVNSGQLDIGLVNTNKNNFFGQLTVAKFGSGAGFTDTAATEAALAAASAASKGFFIYSYGKTADGQGILQAPNAGVVAAPLAQVTSVIAALNASFFQNSAAFLGQAVCPSPGSVNPEGALSTPKGAEPAASCPAPNQWNFGVWNRDAVGDTNIASTNTIINNPAAVPQASHLDTRLAGFQYGLDAGLFNINNSGFNTHMGVTVGDVFTSSVDHANPGITTTAEIPFVGAYGALTGKGFAGIVGVRYDTYRLNLNNAAADVHDQALGARGLTFTTDMQYVIPLGTSAFVEPSGGVYISKVNVDRQPIAAGTISTDPVYSTLSRLGLRLGMASQAGGILLQPFVAANVYHEWAGDARGVFTPAIGAGGAQIIDSTRVGTFEQASVGVGWQVPNTGWTGYVRSDAKFGRQVEGWTLTAGLRYNW